MKSRDYDALLNRMGKPKKVPKTRWYKCDFCKEPVHEAIVDSLFVEGKGHVKCLIIACRYSS